jgi:hypothetical protein
MDFSTPNFSTSDIRPNDFLIFGGHIFRQLALVSYSSKNAAAARRVRAAARAICVSAPSRRAIYPIPAGSIDF